MIDIIPSILIKTREEFLSHLEALDHAVTHLQLDIADGSFVPNTTWSEPDIIAHATDYTFELHLMVTHPLEVIAQWNTVSNVTRLIIHAESTDSLEETIAHIRSSDTLSREIFIALNPDTPLTVIDPVKNDIEGVLFMGVTPGFQGQKLIPSVLSKIVACRTSYPHLYTELDGGVQEDALAAILETGVHAICPGSLVFRQERKAHEQITHIKNQLAQLET